MKPKKNRFLYRLWTRESGLSSMLLLLFAMHFIVIPLFGSHSSFMIMLNIFWMLLVMAGIFTLVKNRQQAMRFSVVPFLFIACQWLAVFCSGALILWSDFFLTLITLLILMVMVLIKVFEPGPVTAYRIIGSIVVYMLVANLWAIVYLFLFHQIAGSFHLTPSVFESNSDQANFMYFSYITITTTGYGEIVPLHPLARSMALVEALFGVLYPVVLIGRLVSDANFLQKL